MVIVELVVELCEIIVALFLDHCWIMFGPFFMDSFGSFVASSWVVFWIIFGSCLDHFGIMVWIHCRSALVV